jgi:hypothetical protein
LFHALTSLRKLKNPELVAKRINFAREAKSRLDRTLADPGKSGDVMIAAT